MVSSGIREGGPQSGPTMPTLGVSHKLQLLSVVFNHSTTAKNYADFNPTLLDEFGRLENSNQSLPLNAESIPYLHFAMILKNCVTRLKQTWIVFTAFRMI